MDKEMACPDEHTIEACLVQYREARHRLSLFTETVARFFVQHPELAVGDLPVVHSVKWRMKDEQKLRAKLVRKVKAGRPISSDNFFTQITDLGGVRVYHLHLEQFPLIDDAIKKQVASGDWVFGEDPKAYSWDPEARASLKHLGLNLRSSQLCTHPFTTLSSPTKLLEIVAKFKCVLFSRRFGGRSITY